MDSNPVLHHLLLDCFLFSIFYLKVLALGSQLAQESFVFFLRVQNVHVLVYVALQRVDLAFYLLDLGFLVLLLLDFILHLLDSPLRFLLVLLDKLSKLGLILL